MERQSVVIVGGGIAGVMTAYFLAREGLENITVVEQNYIGAGSSLRLAGGARAAWTTVEHIALMKRSLEMFERMSRELGFWWRRSGYLWLLTRDDDVKAFREFSRLHNRYGVPTKLISPEEVRELVPTINVDGIVAALYDPSACKFDPFDIIYTIARECRKLGVRFLSRTRATSILVEHEHVRGVKTTRGDLTSNIVVVAAGAGTRDLLSTAGIDVPLENAPRHALVTEAFKETIVPLVIDWSTSSYIIQTRHGNFLIGAEIPERANAPLRPRIEFLKRAAEIWTRYFPWLREVNVLRYWTGYYVMSPDRHPILGPIPGVDGLYVMAGWSGHGFMMAPAAAEAIVDWILRGEPRVKEAKRLTIERLWRGELIRELAVFG